MKKFEDRNLLDDEPMFKMKDVWWYKTENEIIPFVVNNAKTKVKVLTNNKTEKILFKEQPAGDFPEDDDTELLVEDFAKTLFNATGKKGFFVYDRVEFLHDYYFTTSDSKTIYTWMENEIKTQSEIVNLSETLTKNYLKSHEKLLNDSRDF